MKKMTVILTAALFLGVLPLLAIAASQGAETTHGGAMMHNSSTMPYGHMQSDMQHGEHMGHSSQAMHGAMETGNCVTDQGDQTTQGVENNDHRQAMHAAMGQVGMDTNHHDLVHGSAELAEKTSKTHTTALNTPCPMWQSTIQTN